MRRNGLALCVQSTCLFVYLETGQVVVFERGRLETQKNVVECRQTVLRPVRLSVDLTHDINISQTKTLDVYTTYFEHVHRLELGMYMPAGSLQMEKIHQFISVQFKLQD